MDFAFSEEQEMLRAAARDYLRDSLPFDRVAALADGEPGWDPASWRALTDLGWIGLSVPAGDGGAGMSFLEEAVVFEETGAALYPGPLFSTVGLALPLLAGSDLLGPVLAGERTVTLAYAEDAGPRTIGGIASGAARPQVSYEPGRGLTGTKRFVPDLGIVDLVVVVAANGLYTVDLAEHSGAVVRRSTVDRTRRLGDLVLDGTSAMKLPAGYEALGAVRDRALVALACEAVGVASSALRFAADHARTRTQFDRVIGTYQGVSHKVADIYVVTELARSLAYWAAWAVAAGDPSASTAALAARSAAGEAAVAATESAIQVHGGIGFTWDHPLHRYYKRAQAIDAFEGPGSAQRAEIAAMLLDGPPPALADVPVPVVPAGPPLVDA